MLMGLRAEGQEAHLFRDRKKSCPQLLVVRIQFAQQGIGLCDERRENGALEKLLLRHATQILYQGMGIFRRKPHGQRKTDDRSPFKVTRVSSSQ
jgi:hypothetical protein